MNHISFPLNVSKPSVCIDWQLVSSLLVMQSIVSLLYSIFILLFPLRGKRILSAQKLWNFVLRMSAMIFNEREDTIFARHAERHTTF